MTVRNLEGLSLDELDKFLYSMSFPEHDYTRREFNQNIKEAYGEKAYRRILHWWKYGWINFSVYGYIQCTKRGVNNIIRIDKRQKMIVSPKDSS